MNDLEQLGPIDYLVIEFPADRLTGEGMPLLLDLVERGIIRIIDLVFVAKQPDGAVSAVEVTDLDQDGQLDLLEFDGASSGLLGADDLAEAGTVLAPGSIAAVLVYENLWAAPLASALRRGGAQFVAGGRITVQSLLAALDSAEAAEAAEAADTVH